MNILIGILRTIVGLVGFIFIMFILIGVPRMIKEYLRDLYFKYRETKIIKIYDRVRDIYNSFMEYFSIVLLIGMILFISWGLGFVIFDLIGLN